MLGHQPCIIATVDVNDEQIVEVGKGVAIQRKGTTHIQAKELDTITKTAELQNAIPSCRFQKLRIDMGSAIRWARQSRPKEHSYNNTPSSDLFPSQNPSTIKGGSVQKDEEEDTGNVGSQGARTHSLSVSRVFSCRLRERSVSFCTCSCEPRTGIGTFIALGASIIADADGGDVSATSSGSNIACIPMILVSTRI